MRLFYTKAEQQLWNKEQDVHIQVSSNYFLTALSTYLLKFETFFYYCPTLNFSYSQGILAAFHRTLQCLSHKEKLTTKKSLVTSQWKQSWLEKQVKIAVILKTLTWSDSELQKNQKWTHLPGGIPLFVRSIRTFSPTCL